MEIKNKEEAAERQGESMFGSCPYVTTQTIIQGKWALLILHQLEDGPVRFNELLRRIEIAQGTLSTQLKYLEKEGMISRNVCTEGALRVEYDLTPIGRKFKTVLNAIEEWGREYIAYLSTEKSGDAGRDINGGGRCTNTGSV